MSSFADKLNDSLSPYDGTEESPFTHLRVGRVTKVYASAEDTPDDVNADWYVGKVEITWLDRITSSSITPKNQLVPWAYPAFSNPVVKTTESVVSDTPSSTVSQSGTGSSHGIMFTPSVGDLIVCGFRGPSSPVIVGFLPHNLNQQQQSTGGSFGPFRTLRSGEYDIRSLQQAEIYLDRAGTIQMITQSQPTASSGTPPIDVTKVPGRDSSTSELARISLGVTYDSTFTTPTKSAFNQNVVCNIQLSSGARVQIDSAGNVDIQSAAKAHIGAPSGNTVSSGAALALGGLTALLAAPNGITMTGSAVTINDGTKGAARQDDATVSNSTLDSTFWTFMSNLVTVFNAHVHTGVTTGPGSSGPPGSPLGSAPTALVGKVNEGSSTVKIG